ncbi:hypothetical protein AYO38_00635 [bacterium SCGC AG-212-C10]|nr:hypothetical protein AYO38_00635 [bacterium SCGC AG-212-C10]
MLHEAQVRALHNEILASWNRYDARAMAACFIDDAVVVGFDGSTMNGSAEIREQISAVFANHQPAQYVAIVRRVRLIGDGVAVLHAVAGLVPPGGDDVLHEVNAVQLLTAVRDDGRWLAAAYQNTPAAYHGRPELAGQLSAELREEFRSNGVAK